VETVEFFLLKVACCTGRHVFYVMMFRWKRLDLSPVSGMANVIVEIPTGYIVSRDTIEQMYAANFTALKRVQFYLQKLITFFEYVSYYILTLNSDPMFNNSLFISNS